MEKEDIQKLAELRKRLVLQFERCRDYKTNPNAIMKELDHAKWIHSTIVRLDEILKNHVNFS